MKDKRKTAIFDMDGTLLDIMPKMKTDVTQAMQRLGIRINRAEASLPFYTLTRMYGISAEKFDEAFDQRKSWEQSLADGETPLFEDTIPCLDELQNRGIILGVLTKSLPTYTAAKIKFYGLEKYFGNRVVTIHPREPKKDPSAIELTKKIQAETPELERAYFIGDNTGDVTVDKAVHRVLSLPSHGIYLNRNGSKIPEELGDVEYPLDRFIVKTLAEVPAIIKGM